MYKRVGSLVQYGLLATLIIYGLLTHWSVPAIYTFLSIIVLGIVLGLLFLVYNIQSLSGEQKIGTHLGLSALAILVVALFNGWININWTQVFTWLLIISGLVLLAYLGYQYYLNQKAKEPLEEETGAPTIEDGGIITNRYDESIYKDEAEDSQENMTGSDHQTADNHLEETDDSVVVVEYEYDDLTEEVVAEADEALEADDERQSPETESNQPLDPLPEEDFLYEPNQDMHNRSNIDDDYEELNPEDPNYHS